MHFSKRLRTEWQDTCGNLFYLQEVAGGGNCLLRLREKAIIEATIERGLSELSFFPHKGSGIVVN